MAQPDPSHWIDDYLDGHLPPDEVDRLHLWLREDSANVRLLAESAYFHWDIRDALAEKAVSGQRSADSQREAISGWRLADSQRRLEVVAEVAKTSGLNVAEVAETSGLNSGEFSYEESRPPSADCSLLLVPNPSPLAPSSSPIPQSAIRNPHSIPRRHLGPYSIATAAAIMFAFLTGLAMIQVPRSGESNRTAKRDGSILPSELDIVAQFTGGEGFTWGGEKWEAPQPGDHLQAGRFLDLRQGVVEVTFASGAKALVEGPAKFAVEGANAARLDRGNLLARVEPKTAAGFSVATPTATVIDLGTEFGVAVDEEGTAEVQVYVGKVRIFPKQSDDYLSDVQDLKEGEAVRVIAASHDGSVRVEPMAFNSEQRLRFDEPKPVKLFVRGARASSVHNVELYIRGPENLIHNNGLTGDRHYNLPERTMWHSRLGRVKNEFVIFDLGRSCRLDRMKVWNYNEATHRLYLSRGVKEADVYLSFDGKGDPLSAPEAWSLAVRNFQFNPADGTEDYSTPDVVPLEGAAARYAAIVIHDHLAPDPRFPHDPYEQCVGLSEVQFFGHPLEELESGKHQGALK